MFDPGEGVDLDGTIRTGVDRSKVPFAFEPLLVACAKAVSDARPSASLYVYGSVATGMARRATSDVDLLSVGLPPLHAASLAQQLSERFWGFRRGVEIGAARPTDFDGEGDEVYGNRVFLRHYCVHLVGPDATRDVPAFPADRRAARGFNGDLAQHRRRWDDELRAQSVDDLPGAVALGRRIARKSLVAVAGLVSIHDDTWTTDRNSAAERWTQVRPELSGALALLRNWSDSSAVATVDELDVMLSAGGAIDSVIADFQELIGLWA